ncbi:MAG: pentapeptide repeat-containing protein [Crocosphaera sp.]|nr:pentapeptide repeat-containing protein [Crocosphaera sp.]
MRTNEKTTVNPQAPITVKLEDSKGIKELVIQITSVILIPLIVFCLGWFTNNKVIQHTAKVEEAKQLNNYLDKLNTIILDKEGGKQTILIDNRPSFAFNLQNIKEIDYLTRAYIRNLNPKSRRIVLIYLYESGLINHTKAQEDTHTGTEGLCKKNKDLYCNLSTNRYYFDDVDMSNIFLKQIKLHNSYLNGAKFIDARLMGAEFMGSQLKQANFTGANLSNAYFNDASQSTTVLQGADFTNANLSGANL